MAVALALAAGSAAAQERAPASDSARAPVRTTLHAFYFNLAHRDWEAMAADILPAKVVAHRPAPAAMVTSAAAHDARAAGLAERPAVACGASGPLVDLAAITMDGDWAEVSVPRCSATAGSDEFRLIRFEARWRIVYIDLYESDPPGAPCQWGASSATLAIVNISVCGAARTSSRGRR